MSKLTEKRNKNSSKYNIAGVFICVFSPLSDSSYCLHCVEDISLHCDTCMKLPQASQEKKKNRQIY